MNMSWGGYRENNETLLKTIEKNNKVISKTIEDIDLSLTEKATLKWLAQQDKERVEAICKVIKKSRAAGFERALEILNGKEV